MSPSFSNISLHWNLFIVGRYVLNGFFSRFLRYLVEFVLPGDNVLPRDDVSLDSGFSDEDVEDMEGRIFMKNFSFLVWLDRGKTLGKFRELTLF